MPSPRGCADCGCRLTLDTGWVVKNDMYYCYPCSQGTQPIDKNTFARYPHKCPRCGGPAYIGLKKIDCMEGCK